MGPGRVQVCGHVELQTACTRPWRTASLAHSMMPDPLPLCGPAAPADCSASCAALYTQGALRDVYACVACKVCAKLQALNGQDGFVCTPAAGCAAPYPGRQQQYFVNCGEDGPHVQPGAVVVPPSVYNAIAGISC